ALSAVHQRNLNRLWQVPVLDRTELILEIFARRAQSQEGQAQVELARLQHQSTRLVRMWTHLERQRGGIGVRGGPGERQIELDRRMIETKIRRLRERLTLMAKQRQTRRKARQRQGAFKISLVGYTNAGKSESAWSKTTSVMASLSISFASSSAFPLPIKKAGSGRSLRQRTRVAGSKPADKASAFNSSRSAAARFCESTAINKLREEKVTLRQYRK
ncbi:MAG: hypothetical protein EBW73_12835, partial [Betaproteobacteria bacterium]|nr:hypothetical protein [Betaproteobacteria bacterium]